jgi:hypothetical protein
MSTPQVSSTFSPILPLLVDVQLADLLALGHTRDLISTIVPFGLNQADWSRLHYI